MIVNDDRLAGVCYEPERIVLTLQARPPDEAKKRAVGIFYTNHRGVKSKKHVIPFDIVYGVAEPWHREPQWLMVAYDLVWGAWRIFALDRVSGWISWPYEDARFGLGPV